MLWTPGALLPQRSFERAAAVVVALALAVRMAHLAFALRSPLTFQLGPDEDYYLRFAQDVAFGGGGLQSEFAFMDPLYGYLLGAVLKLVGNPHAMYPLQVLVDCGTVVMLLLIGRDLGRPRVGLLAGAMYALVGPAVAMTTALLKEIWVAAFLCGWVLAAIRLARARHAGSWLLFGMYCGVGVALRSNLLLLALLGALILPISAYARIRSIRGAVLRSLLMVAGLAVPLALLAWRNDVIDGRWSPLPTNGGVVLHQLYNPENPQSRSAYPAFVRYAHPSEAWRAYRHEAERRAGRSLSAGEADAYWRGLAIDYIKANPLQSILNGLRKAAEFTSWREVPNNRFYEDERLFSPVLRVMPAPFAVLFALGLPGLILLLRRPGSGWLLWLPTLTGVATVVVFFAEDRFRLVVVPMFAFGAALWLAWLVHAWRAGNRALATGGLMVSVALAGASAVSTARMPEPRSNWQRIATGWLKLGEHGKVQRLLDEVAGRDPSEVGLDEYRGLLALENGDPLAARRSFERALERRRDRHEVWHNYATALSALGEHELALFAQSKAYQLRPGHEYQFAIGEKLEASGRIAEARAVFEALARSGGASEYAARARERLAVLATRSPAS